MRALVPHSEAKSLYVTSGSMLFPGFASEYSFVSPRYTDITAMDNRHWPFSVFNVDDSLAYAIAHSENYTISDYYNGYWWPKETDPNFKWFSSLSLLRTTSRGVNDVFGYAFSPQPFNGVVTHPDKFLVAHPAPPGYGSPGKVFTWGIMSPTNMIEDGGYVYFFAQHLPAQQRPSMQFPDTPPYSSSGKAGPILFRCAKHLMGQTGNINNRNGNYWEIFNSSGQWQYITRFDWIDASVPEAPIKPYVFFRNYSQNNWFTNLAMIQSVRKVGSKIVTIGTNYGGGLHFSHCTSLASPVSLDYGLTQFRPADGIFNYQEARYISVFDPGSSDLNYSDIAQNNSRVRLVVANNNLRYGLLQYQWYPITFSNF